jgi:hypothetical protein
MVNCFVMQQRAWLVVVTVLGSVAHAQASAETWGLKWNAPAGCLQAADLAERVERHAGRPLFAAQARRHIEGYLAAEAQDTFRVRVTLLDHEGRVLGTRELVATAATCRELDERIVLVLALLIAPFTETAPPAEPSPAPRPLTPPKGYASRSGALASAGPLLEVREGECFAGGVRISQDRFYRLLGRADLARAMSQRSGGRTALFVVGGLSAGVGAVLLGLGVSDLGCVRFTGTPGAPGTCLERTPSWLVAAGIAVVAAVTAFVGGGALEIRPTTHQEDERLASEHNARLPAPVSF